MEKVIRATERAKTQARRKNLIRREKLEAQRRVNERRQTAGMFKDKNSNIIQPARIARREDWLLGPLAPRRDLGSSKDTYGTVEPFYLDLPASKSGKFHDYCIAKGDRVVIVGESRDQGVIGTVKKVRIKEETCTVEGINMVDIAIPEKMRGKTGDNSPIQTVEAPIPLSAVRLVYPLRHAETDSIRDVVIKELKPTPNSERKQGLDGRYVADTDPKLYIPFPEKEEDEALEHDIDTLRIEVEEKTWTPTLTRPPMPPSIIDELRNKYSVFRDRHDEGWVKAREKRAAEREKETVERDEMMLTPLEELRRLKRLERSKVMEEPLSSEILKRIGELMAQNKAQLAPVKNVQSMVRYCKSAV